MPIKRPLVVNKKKDLLARKEQLLNNIKYHERRIKELEAPVSYIDDSSDSDTESCPFRIAGPTVSELQREESRLRTDYYATQELAGLEVYQHKVSVMMDDPVLTREPPVTAAGTWSEVMAECRIDMVPFSITFYVHQAAGKFGGKSYRGVNVIPTKKVHELELSKSILSRVSSPSNAVEVLRYYAQAYRSRRTTLSKLADHFPHALFMEPMPEGGFRLTCGKLLKITWFLENLRSPYRPFHQKLLLSVEYMDESYVNIIKPTFKQLSDPSIDTDQRTLLLAKIIDTCLEAERNAIESNESETVSESEKRAEKRRLNTETSATVAKKTKNANENTHVEGSNRKGSTADKDGQIMAPPQSLPKRMKAKGKENEDENRKAVKRSTHEGSTTNVKKARIDRKTSEVNKRNNDHINEVNDKTEKAVGNTKVVHNKDKTAKSQNNVENESTNATGDGNIQKHNANTAQKKNNENAVQEISKKTISKDKESHKVSSVEKNTGSKSDPNSKECDKTESDKEKQCIPKKVKPITENNAKESTDAKDANKKIKPKAKNSETQKVANKETAAGSKNPAQSKDSNKEKEASKDKKSSPTNDQNIAHNNDINKANTNAKIATKKVTAQPTVQKNSNNAKNDKVPKRVKTVNNQKSSAKNTVESKTETNKDSKNDDNIENNALSKNVLKKTNTKGTIGQNTKESVNKNTKGKTEPKTDKPAQKANENNTNSEAKQPLKESNANKGKKIENQPNITKDIKNPNAQKSQLKINDQRLTIIQNKGLVASTPKITKYNETEKEPNNGIATGKIAKTSSVATSNKEQVASTATVNNKNTKSGDGKPNRMVIKSLSHKNPSQNMLLKNLTGNTKNVKAANAGKDLTGNSSKDSTGSKIPKLLPFHENLKKNPLRISPRRFPSTFKTTSNSSVQAKETSNIPRRFPSTFKTTSNSSVQAKETSNIPRMMKKPETKLLKPK